MMCLGSNYDVNDVFTNKLKNIINALMKKSDLSVVKNNASIHIDTRELTLTHRKAFNIFLWNAWDHLEKNQLHSIPIWELCKLLDFHNTQKLYTKLEKMPFIRVRWNIFGDKGWSVNTGCCALLSGFHIDGKNFQYSFYEGFRPFLKNPMVWTKLRVEICNLFSSSYALALYETCARYASVGSTGWKSSSTWRKILGTPETKYYQNFGIVNREILKKIAIKQINKLSDLLIEASYKRKGRGGSISEILFKIEKKKSYSLEKIKKNFKLSKKILTHEIARYPTLETNPVRKQLEEKRLKSISYRSIPKYMSVKFDTKPPKEIRIKLMDFGFKWHSDEVIWKGKGVGNDIASLVYPYNGEIKYTVKEKK